MCFTQPSNLGLESIQSCSIAFGRRKINSLFIRGKWMRFALKSKESGIIFWAIDVEGITLDIWLYKKQDTQAA